MYDYGYSYGYGLIGGNTYNPLINYDWSTTTASGLRYLKDVGSTPTYDASMYFGIGAYLNGVDQTITVPINTTIQTALKRVNGIVTINETSQTLTDYIISGLGVHKDYYLFTRLLTTSEKDSYTNTPELFYAMAQADSTCVLNMPMCETDGYVRNMKSYSEGDNLVTNGTFSSDLSGWSFDTVGGQATYSAGRCHLINNGSGYAGIKQYLAFIEQLCLFSFDYEKISGDIRFQAGTNVQIASMITKHYDMFVTPSSAFLYFGGTVAGEGYLDNIIVKKVTGIHSITNYTSSVRDNAKNLQYGLQTCKFVRDSLGVIQSASNYLECDGTGYADTGWIPPTNTNFTIECIIELNPISMYQQNGSGNLQDAKIHFGLWNDNKPYMQGRNSVVVYKPAITVKTIMCFTVVKEGSVNKLFINNELLSTQVDSQITESMPFILGKRATFISKSPIRLFKVHNKALTQAEITANYNSYQNKGLLV